jgi:hypothetical protein
VCCHNPGNNEEHFVIGVGSMHDEDMRSSLGSSSASLYMKELCDHLKVFRTHVSHILPISESLEALPNFINFIIEQYLLHTSLVRPVSDESNVRFVKDFEYLVGVRGLQPFNCTSSKYLNSYRVLVEFLKMPLSSVTSPDMIRKPVPLWFAAQRMISDSPSELPSPHESAGWTVVEYVRWFNASSPTDHFQFLHNLLASYKQSLISSKVTNYVPHYPAISAIVQKAIEDIHSL